MRVHIPPQTPITPGEVALAVFDTQTMRDAPADMVLVSYLFECGRMERRCVPTCILHHHADWLAGRWSSP